MKRILLFIVLIIFSLILANYFGGIAGDYLKDDAAKENEYKKKDLKNGRVIFDSSKTAVLFMGASDMQSGVNVGMFDSLAGEDYVSYNFGLLGMPSTANYFLLKDYLQFNVPPKYIICDLVCWAIPGHEPAFDVYSCEGSDFKELKEYIIYRKPRNYLYNYLLPCHNYNKETIRYLKLLFTNKDTLCKLNEYNEEIKRGIIDNNGYTSYGDSSQILGDVSHDFRGGGFKKNYPLDDDLFVIKFLDLAKENGIKILLTNTPCYEGRYDQFEALPDCVNEAIKRYDNVDILGDKFQIPFYPKSHFVDIEHLNDRGSKKYTREVANQFLNTISN
ncbi:hypothetical protein OAO55_02560 [Bacteroidales bacterium]|nr:hypothetical protein [Bacteroidales bacterium]